jgi:hypothetical protein
VNVIFNSSDLNSSRLVMSGDTADVGPDAIFNFGCDPRFTIFGAKGEW